MTETTQKIAAPPYVSSRTLMTFFNQLRDAQIVPDLIDRSFLSKMNGAAQNEVQLALRYFGFTDDSNRSLPALEAFAFADDNTRKAELHKLVKDKYGFVFNTPGLNIEKATTNQVAEAFRLRKLNGSTLSRAVSLFISLATLGEIKLASFLKAPPIARETQGKKRKNVPVGVGNGSAEVDDGVNSADLDPSLPKPHNFEIPIPGKSSVKISVPANFDSEDWELLTTMFQAYVKRWKNFVAN
jgi:hypothetical protein